MNQQTQIMQLGAEVLRQQAAAIDDFEHPDFLALVNTLHRIMLEANGVGIAAPQLGYSKQLILIASRPTPRYPNAPQMEPTIMVNPQFDVLDDHLNKDWEGCLSVPGIRALVPRFTAIRVRYQNPQGQHCQIDLRDFPARVFQHEFDHLLGLVYLDRVENNRDIIAESEYLKLIATQESVA